MKIKKNKNFYEIDKNIAASLLSEINNDIKLFINKLVKQYPNDKPIMRLYKKFSIIWP